MISYSAYDGVSLQSSGSFATSHFAKAALLMESSGFNACPFFVRIKHSMSLLFIVLSGFATIASTDFRLSLSFAISMSSACGANENAMTL